MQDYSIEYLMEKEENDDQNDYVYEIQHCKVKLNLIHSTDLSVKSNIILIKKTFLGLFWTEIFSL